MKQIQLQVNTDLNGIAAGAVIAVQVDERGVPLDPYWRRRLADAASDGCAAVLDNTATKPQRARKPKSPTQTPQTQPPVTKADDHDDD